MHFVISVVLTGLLGSSFVHAFDNLAMEKYARAGKICNVEGGGSDSDVQDALQLLPAASYEAKCMRACVMKEFNLLGADGKLSTEGAREEAQKYTGHDPAKLDLALKMSDLCEAISVPDDHCEAAEMYSNCFFAESKKNGLL